ncbi:MAG: hypothetical protein AB1689_15195 [Thermodesulfobacteriota bacterium]
MFRNARGTVFLLSFLSLSFLAAPAARAVQTGGSISLFPTDWGLLKTGDVIDVVIAVNNTSTDTPASDFPGDGVDPVSAKLSGAITVLLACADPECTTQVAGKLKFVPVGPSGCVAKANATESCDAAGADAVIVSLKPSGITIPGEGSVDVATIRIEVIDDEGLTRLGLKGMSDPAALKACSTSEPNVCAECDATGCTTLAFNPQPRIIACPHACPERIIFRGDASTPDFFEFHALIEPGLINPPNETFTLSLGNALFDPMFSFTLPPGSFTAQGKTFTFRDNGARQTGGIAFVKIAERVGAPGFYKIDIQAFDAGLESEATLPDMTVRFAIGNDPFETTNVWIQKPNGWLLNLPEPLP